MSAAHTPGPWEHVRLSGVCGPHAIRMIYNGDKTFYGVREIAREEDARAIAALPALLDLLCDALEIIDDQLPGEFPAFSTDARAAISLAKGEAK